MTEAAERQISHQVHEQADYQGSERISWDVALQARKRITWPIGGQLDFAYRLIYRSRSNSDDQTDK